MVPFVRAGHNYFVTFVTWSQEVSGAKTKTKKPKKQKTVSSSVTQQWSELFTLPDRHCESAATAGTEEDVRRPR